MLFSTHGHGREFKSMACLVQSTAVWFGSNNAKEKKFYQHLNLIQTSRVISVPCEKRIQSYTKNHSYLRNADARNGRKSSPEIIPIAYTLPNGQP